MNYKAAVQQAILLAVFSLTAEPMLAQNLEALSQPPPPLEGRVFWHPPEPGQMGFFGAIHELAQSLQQDKYLSDRGQIRSMSFQYRAFRYEKDFFNIYRGVLLHSFLDGRVDLGLYSHKPNRQYFGRQLPGSNRSRYELLLRLNLY
jgi:hypothetical protein